MNPGNLLIVGQNPLADLKALRKPAMVLREGVIVVGSRPDSSGSH
jgi:hypothetical protein